MHLPSLRLLVALLIGANTLEVASWYDTRRRTIELSAGQFAALSRVAKIAQAALDQAKQSAYARSASEKQVWQELGRMQSSRIARDRQVDRAHSQVLSLIKETPAAIRNDAQVEALNWLRVHPIAHLVSITLPQGPAKGIDTDLRSGVDVAKPFATSDDISKWQPTNHVGLPLACPAGADSEKFDPYCFAVNASAVARTPALLANPELRDRFASELKSASVQEGDALFVQRSAAYEFLGHMYEPGWRSAFANAAVVFGLSDFCERTSDQGLRRKLAGYAKGLTSSSTDRPLWSIDASQYLWFEEYPAIDGRATHVINGHMAAVLALYRYEQVTGDQSVRPYIEAGLATALRYVWQARNPGHVLSYALYDPSVADYGPQRTMKLVDLLYQISGADGFRELLAALRTDMPIK